MSKTRLHAFCRIVEPFAVIFAFLVSGASAIAEYTMVKEGLAQPGSLPLRLETIMWLVGSYLFARVMFLAWDGGCFRRKTHAGLIPLDSKLGRWVIYSLAIFVVWLLIWLIPHYPGTLRDDTISELFQTTGTVGWYTQHPVFTTMVFGAFWSLGEALGNTSYGLFVFVLVNSFMLASSIAACIVYGEEHGAPGWLVAVVLVFVAFGRLFYQPADAMSKDSINAWLFAYSVLMFVHAVATRGRALKDPKFLAATIILAFLCMVSKRIMVIVLPASYILLLVILVLSRRRAQEDRDTPALVSVACTAAVPALAVVLLWNPITNAVLDVYQTKSYEMYSVPVQQLFFTASKDPDAITDEEKVAIGTFLDYDGALGEFNPTRSDEVFRHIASHQSVPTGLLSAWVSAGFRNPGNYAKALVVLAGRWSSLRAMVNYGHDSEEELLNDGRMEAWAREAFGGNIDAAREFFSNYNWSHPESISAWTAASEAFDAFQCRWACALTSYGVCCFLLPMALLAWCASRKKGYALLSATPVFLVMGTLLVGPMVLYWYTAPLVFTAPLLLMLPFAFVGDDERQKAAKRAYEIAEMKPREIMKEDIL